VFLRTLLLAALLVAAGCATPAATPAATDAESAATDPETATAISSIPSYPSVSSDTGTPPASSTASATDGS